MSDHDVEALERQIEDLKKQLHKLRRERLRQGVSNATFLTASGTTTLLDLFGDRDDLLLIHNMGKDCNYCTLWADGFVGFTRHLQDRTSVAMVSPDSPQVQSAFAASRGWSLPLVSYDGTQFASEMGMLKIEGGRNSFWPGVSGFRRTGDTIERIGWAYFGPGDDYCAIWHLLELLDGGPGPWEPKLAYGA